MLCIVMEITAKLKHLHIAPRKVRKVGDLIRGKDVSRAEWELQNAHQRSAEPLLKLLRSAIADASHNFVQEKKNLYVKGVRMNPGPVLKRLMPRAFGRGARIRKRTSHVELTLGVRGEGLKK